MQRAMVAARRDQSRVCHTGRHSAWGFSTAGTGMSEHGDRPTLSDQAGLEAGVCALFAAARGSGARALRRDFGLPRARVRTRPDRGRRAAIVRRPAQPRRYRGRFGADILGPGRGDRQGRHERAAGSRGQAHSA